MPVERGVGGRDDRPCAGAGGGFTGQVTGIELLEGSLDVFDVEHDDGCDSVVGIDFDDVEQFCLKAQIDRGLEADTRESRSPRVASTVDVVLSAIPTSATARMSRSRHPDRVGARVHDATAIVSGTIVGKNSAMASQSRAAKCVQKLLVHLACRVFQPWCRRLSCRTSQARCRGPASSKISQWLTQIAFDHEKPDLPPLGFEVLLRGPARACVTTVPTSFRRCTTRCRHVDVPASGQTWRERTRLSRPRSTSSAPVVDHRTVWSHRAISCFGWLRRLPRR